MLAWPHFGSAQAMLRTRPDSTIKANAYQPPVMNGGTCCATPGAVYASASVVLLCAGDHTTLTATGGDGNYVWSANVSPAALSSTVGNKVVAGPLVFTTYTVTSHNPNSPYNVVTATLSITVAENCCPTSKSPASIVELYGSLYNSTTGSPFATAPAGTRFHLNGPSPIVFRDLAYAPPVGSVLLLDANCDLVLENGASLNLTGVSITAACNDMWGKLLVRGSAGGITTTLPTVPPFTPVSTLRNQISHSLGGIEYEEAPAGTPAAQVPVRNFVYTDFLHNEQSFKLRRSAGVTNPNDQVTYCAFNSKPESFKAPMAFLAGNANYPHYARYHVWFTGNAGSSWSSSTYQNALFGFHSPDDLTPPTLYLSSCQFTNIYLAGVNLNNTRPGGRLEISDAGNSFTFPTQAGIQSWAQVAAARATDVLDQLPETRGIYTNNTPVILYAVSFTQPNGSVYSTFAFTERDKQLGVKTRRLTSLTNCSFTYLHTGVEMREVINSLPQNAITGNVFTACRRGLEVHGIGIAARGGLINPGQPASVTLPLGCNTFDRVNSTRSGVSYGIYLETDAQVSFDPLTGVARTLTNKFLDYATGAAGFYAFFNGSNALGGTVKYTTFNDYITNSSPAVLPGHSRLGVLGYNVVIQGAGNYQGSQGQYCGFGNPGLERQVGSGGSLTQCFPNPATHETTFNYQLPMGTGVAELRVQRGVDGQPLQRIDLPLTAKQFQIKVVGWSPGLYFTTLYADGVPVQTQRLLVQ